MIIFSDCAAGAFLSLTGTDLVRLGDTSIGKLQRDNHRERAYRSVPYGQVTRRPRGKEDSPLVARYRRRADVTRSRPPQTFIRLGDAASKPAPNLITDTTESSANAAGQEPVRPCHHSMSGGPVAAIRYPIPCDREDERRGARRSRRARNGKVQRQADSPARPAPSTTLQPTAIETGRKARPNRRRSWPGRQRRQVAAARRTWRRGGELPRRQSVRQY